jgi:pyruvate kinase
MLSGETASGKYPVEAVKTMSSIAEQAERDRAQNHIDIKLSENCDIREFMAHSAIEATERLGVKGIITDSTTGTTARSLAAFRGPHPVLAICYNDKLQRLLNLSYGVIPVYQKEHIGSEKLFLAAVRMLRQKGYVELDDKIAYLSGNIGAGGATKFLEINTVKEVFEQNYQFHLPNV